MARSGLLGVWLRHRRSHSAFLASLAIVMDDAKKVSSIATGIQSGLMQKAELTQRQVCSVPCPTSGATVGKGCALYSDGLRSVPHPARKLSAITAIERKLAHLRPIGTVQF